MTPSRITALALGAVLLAHAGPASAQAQGQTAQGAPELLEEVGFDQKLGSQVPLDTWFRDASGEKIQLSSIINGDKPVILAMVYYECPMLCTLVLNGMLRAFSVLEPKVEQDFDVVAISIDQDETPFLASQKKREYVNRYRRPESAPGWHFLTGEASQIQAVAESIGFRFAYDEKNDQWAHASGLVVLTPQGKASRYLYGVEYRTKDLRLSLVEASQGKIGTIVDDLLLLCFQYDPSIGKYSLAVMNTLRIGAVLTILLLGGFVLLSLKKEKDDTGESNELPKGMKNHA